MTTTPEPPPEPVDPEVWLRRLRRPARNFPFTPTTPPAEPPPAAPHDAVPPRWFYGEIEDAS